MAAPAEALIAPCAACGTPVIGAYYTTPRSPGARWCQACMGARPKCDFCGMPIGGTQSRYPDGRRSCGTCAQAAFRDPSALPRLDARVRPLMASRCHLQVRPLPASALRLVDHATLSRSTRGGAQPNVGRERGLCQIEWSSDGKTVSEARFTVFVEDGHSELESLGILAHELTHVWQHDNLGTDKRDPIWYEGFAVWVQAHVLRAVGAQNLADELAKRPDRVYGGGYRMFAEIERREGSRGVLRHLVAG